MKIINPKIVQQFDAPWDRSTEYVVEFTMKVGKQERGIDLTEQSYKAFVMLCEDPRRAESFPVNYG